MITPKIKVEILYDPPIAHQYVHTIPTLAVASKNQSEKRYGGILLDANVMNERLSFRSLSMSAEIDARKRQS